MTNARDKANIPVLNFQSKGIDDNADATAITIDSSENVGIGNSVASTINSANGTGNLVVGSGSGTEGITIYSGTTGEGTLQFADGTSGASTYVGQINYNHSSNFMSFGANGSERMRIDSSGRVIIGGTTPDTSAKLTLEGGDLRFNTDDKGILWGNNEINGNNASDFINIVTANTERMRIDSSGNVGIGTTSPLVKLHILGTENNADTQAIRLSENSTQGGFIKYDGNVNELQLGGFNSGENTGIRIARNDATTMFNTNGSERMRIDSGGRLLVGTTSPYSNNNAISIALNTTNSTSSPFPQGIVYRKLNFQGSNAVAVDFQDFAGNREGSIQFNESGTSFNTSSDYRLKENIVEITDATSRLKQLKPKRFNFIADANKTVDGFIAHEVSSIVPEAITGTKDAIDTNGKPIYQGIDQSKLVPLLVKTIQELEARITTLEANNP